MHTYWEPLNGNYEYNWSNWAGTETDDKGISALLEAEYTIPVSMPNGDTPTSKVLTRRFEQPFTVNTRELKPATGTEKPMQGSDVAMLEAMLWQFGISPQRGTDNKTDSKAGEQGNRINSTRFGTTTTKNCDKSDAKTRDLYSGGWAACSNRDVALEAMVRRFQGRNTATCDDGSKVSCTDEYAGRTSSTTGVIDQTTLTMIEKTWREYYSAYSSVHKSNPIINAPELSWSNAAISIWDRVDAGFVKTYTDDKHNAMLAATNNRATDNRGALLDAWIRQESANKFWGQGHPPTPYRVFEGGGDEFASLGYNQIKYAYRYGAQTHQTKCPQLKDYNMYKPDDNIKAMVAFTVAIGCGSGGGFRQSFATGGSWTTMKSNNVDLKGYKLDGENTFHAMDKDRVDDAYELLAKAIGSYNGGTGMHDYTWANMLKATNPGLDKGKPKMGTGHSNKTYALQVLRRFGAPARTYIWKGGKNPADMPILDASGNPELEADGVTQKVHPDAGKDWCFAYGENEWMSGKNWADIKDAADNEDAIGNYKTPVGRVNCQ